MGPPSLRRSMLESACEAILENLAIVRVGRPRSLAEAARRDAGGAMKGAHEVRQVGEADIECDIADRPIVRGQRPGRAAQPATAAGTDAASRRRCRRTAAGNETGSGPRCRAARSRSTGSCAFASSHKRGFDGAPAIARRCAAQLLRPCRRPAPRDASRAACRSRRARRRWRRRPPPARARPAP